VKGAHDLHLAGLRGRQAHDAYAEIRRAIVEGSLAPGTRLLETDLAGHLAISRSSVRTALHRLQHEGFVDASATSTRSRLTVCPLTGEDFWELSEIVGELEGLAAERAANLPPAERRELVTALRGINQRLANAIGAKTRNRSMIFSTDDEFHNTLVNGSTSRRLRILHQAVKPQLQRYEGVYFTMAERIEDSVKEHEAAVDAIEAGRVTAAHQAIRRNLMNAAAYLARRIEERGEVGAFVRQHRSAAHKASGGSGRTVAR
jgi:DNA-binding GntR family transcriptional regulator